jgi:hypothetical protein
MSGSLLINSATTTLNSKKAVVKRGRKAKKQVLTNTKLQKISEDSIKRDEESGTVETADDHNSPKDSLNNQKSKSEPLKLSVDGSNMGSKSPSTFTILDNDISLRKRNTKATLKDSKSDIIESLSSKSTESKQKKNKRRRKANQNYASSKSENIDLAQRRDVVNKTILRALRRFYTQKLKENSVGE